MKPTLSVWPAALALAASLAGAPALAIPPKTYVAPGAESYTFDLAFGELGALSDQFNMPDALDVDADGNVWVADTYNHRVSKFDAAGNYLFSFGGNGSGDGQLFYPRGIAVDTKREQVWVSDSSNSRVQKFDLKGQFLCKNDTLTVPKGLAVRASTGDVYVSNFGVNTIVRMNNDCVPLDEWGTVGSGDGEFSQPNGVALDAAGNVYVADYGNDRIQKFDAAGNFVTKFGTSGTGDSRYATALQLDGPSGLDIDASGDLFVTDYANHRIQKVRTNGSVVTLWGWKGTGKGQLNHPVGIATDGNGRVFVADVDNARIVRFSPSQTDQSHRFIDDFGASGTGNGQFASPIGIARNPSNGFLYVTDADNNRVEVFDGAGAFQFAFGGAGTANTKFNGPHSVAVDPANGAVYVTDTNNNRVQKFDANGAFVTKWGTSGYGNAQFINPTGIAVDPLTHDVWVVDGGNHRLQRFTQDGVFVRGIGSGVTWTVFPLSPQAGNANSWFSSPFGVAVDPGGNVYVTDTGNHRVQKFDTDGEFLLRFGAQGAGPVFGKGLLNAPQGIAADATGVTVADTNNNRVQRYAGDGRFLAAFGSVGGSAPVPGGLFNAPTGIALSGNLLFVTDRTNNRVQRFERFGLHVTTTPSSRTIAAGGTATFDLRAKLVGSNTLGTKVAFKVLSGRPAGSTLSFSRNQVKPLAAGAKSTLTIVTDPGTAAKTFKIPVEVEGGGQTRVITLTLTVTSP